MLVEEGRLPRTVANLTCGPKLPSPHPNPPVAGGRCDPRHQSPPQLRHDLMTDGPPLLGWNEEPDPFVP